MDNLVMVRVKSELRVLQNIKSMKDNFYIYLKMESFCHFDIFYENICNFTYLLISIKGSVHLKKKLKNIEFSRTGLTPPPPPIWTKLWEILKQINCSMASTSKKIMRLRWKMVADINQEL